MIPRPLGGNPISRWIAAFFSCVFCFVALEIAVRLFGHQYTYSTLLELMGERYVAGDFIPFTLKPSYRARMPSQEFPGRYVTVSINRHGLRGPEVSRVKPAGTKRVLVLGDSYTFGLFVGDDETYPSVLEKLLNRSGSPNVEVINAGYADGWSPDEHYVWLNSTGFGFDPDLVIYGFFSGNDITGIDARHWITRDGLGLPTRIVNPDVYVDDVGRLRSRVKDDKTVGGEAIYRVPILRESHALLFLDQRLRWLFGSAKGSADRPNRGWGENPLPILLKPAESNDATAGNEALFLRLVEGMATCSRERKVEFLLLMIPMNFQVHPQFLPKVLGSNRFRVQRNFFEEIKPELTALGIPFVDLLERMRAAGGRYFPSNGEVHFNPQGNAFAAQAIRDYLMTTASWR